MADWKEYKLGEIATIVDCEHKTAPLVEMSDYISVRTTDISNGKIDFQKANRVSLETYTEWTKRLVPKENDIILAREAPVGEVGWIEKNRKVCLGQRTVLLRPDNEKICPKYLLYYLANPATKYELVSHSTGSVVEHLNVKDIRGFELKVHSDLKEQRAIAEVLSSLDDKIALLHRQNKTLEAMAETLFRQWFVEEAESNWESGKLGDFIEIKHGYAFKGTNIVADETDKILVTPGNFKIGGGFNFHKYKFFNSEEFPKSYVFVEGDFVVTMTDLSQDTDTLGYPAFIPEIIGKRLLHNQRVGKVLFREKHSDKKYFLYYLMKSAEYRHYILGSSSGMAVAHTSPTAIYGFEFNVPPLSLITRFEEQATIFHEKERANQKQIQALTKLRDTLLPKLMSGDEVRVKV